MRGGTAGTNFAVPMQWIRDRLPRESQWAEIAPLEKARPFWAGDIDQLPLSCVQRRLEEQGRWSELRSVAEFWTAHDPDNPTHTWRLALRCGAWRRMRPR